MIQYEDIIENLSVGMIAIDTDARVEVFNQAAEKITEVSRTAVIGRPAAEVFRRDPNLVAMLGKTLAEGRLFAEYDEKLHCRFSGVIPVSITTHRIFDADGAVTGAVALIRDLTSMKALEAGSTRKDRLTRIGTFAANLAHEIRNPLSGIKGAAQIASKKVVDAKAAECLAVISREVDRLNNILNNILDFSRPANLVKKELNIHKLLDSVVFLVNAASQANAEIIAKEYDPSLPPISGDEGQLTQALLNLVKNAIESLGRNGRVTLVTRMPSEFHIAGQGNKPVKTALIEIRDNGCGIKPEDLDNIFTPFFTTKAKGSGLGMAITLKIIKDHDGDLKITSTLGKGTIVSIYLPISTGGTKQ